MTDLGRRRWGRLVGLGLTAVLAVSYWGSQADSARAPLTRPMSRPAPRGGPVTSPSPRVGVEAPGTSAPPPPFCPQAWVDPHPDDQVRVPLDPSWCGVDPRLPFRGFVMSDYGTIHAAGVFRYPGGGWPGCHDHAEGVFALLSDTCEAVLSREMLSDETQLCLVRHNAEHFCAPSKHFARLAPTWKTQLLPTELLSPPCVAFVDTDELRFEALPITALSIPIQYSLGGSAIAAPAVPLPPGLSPMTCRALILASTGDLPGPEGLWYHGDHDVGPISTPPRFLGVGAE